ncbi:MAG: family 10 glycosylhydrolase [Haliscomenobacter sp.]|nr:family 10 glycosylhydrolase [Haliscomenobacter sp.]
MEKRTFLQILGSGIAGAMLGPHLEPLGFLDARKKLPSRWIWMRPSLEWTDDQFRAAFDQMASAGIEGVLPQVFDSNQALFELPGFTKARLLERMIPLAHASGLQVHAWIWCMPCNNPSVIQQHPDWFAVNRLGEPAHEKPAYVGYYKFLCPCHPEVRQFIRQRVEALGQIPDLDGIHLDYIRFPDVILAEGLQPNYGIVQDKEYPQYDYGYGPSCIEPFRQKTGIDPLALEDPSANDAWRQYRYDAVTELVNAYLVPAAKKYGKAITAAVFPNWQSVRQEWHRWDLDGFLPMLYQGFYNEDIAWIGKETRHALDRMKPFRNRKPVYSGLFLPHLPSGSDLQEAIRTARAAGGKGFALFDWNSMKPEHWDALMG